MNAPVFFLTEEEQKARMSVCFATIKAHRAEHREAARLAFEALDRIVEAMRSKSGQAYTLRAVLYSLWSGKSASVSDVLGLDWPLRKDVCAVLLGFGFEANAGGVSFFYDEVKEIVTEAGLFEWFIQAGAVKGGAL